MGSIFDFVSGGSSTEEVITDADDTIVEDQVTSVTDDSKGQGGVEGQEQEGQNTQQVVQDQGGSQQTVETDRVLQTQGVVEEVVQEQTTEPKKKKIDFKEFVESNKEVFNRYLNEKDKDYSSLTDAEAVKLKLQREHPEWDNSDIELVLQDDYGVGLLPITINKDEMTDDEIRDAERYNRSLSRSIAKLKSEGKTAKSYLEGLKEDIILPEFEIDDVDPEEIFKSKLDSYIEQDKEYREKTWKPMLEKGVGEIQNISQNYEIEINGNKEVVSLDYKLTDEDKGVLISALVNRQARDEESDKQYLNQDGSINFKRLIEQEGKVHLMDSIVKAVAREAATKTRQSLIKDKLVNFQEPKTITTGEITSVHPSMAKLEAFGKRN